MVSAVGKTRMSVPISVAIVVLPEGVTSARSLGRFRRHDDGAVVLGRSGGTATCPAVLPRGSRQRRRPVLRAVPGVGPAARLNSWRARTSVAP